MKITLKRDVFEKKLNASVAVISGKPLIPVLNEALIKIEEDKMLITTSDSEITFTNSLQFEEIEGEPIDFVCDINTILRTLQLLKNELIILEVDDKNVKFSTPRTKKNYQVPITYSPDYFPTISAEKWSEPFIINGKSLSGMIKRAVIIVNPNDLRAGMQGVYMNMSNGVLSVQSTNANVCSSNTYKYPEESGLDDFGSALIPRGISKVIDNYLKSPKLEVSRASDGVNLRLHDGSSTTYVRLLDGKFPNVDSLYENYTSDVCSVINRESLVLAIKRISIFINKTSKTLSLDFSGESLLVKGGDVDFRKNAEEEVEVVSKNELMDFEVGFNNDFFMTILNTMGGENINLFQSGYNVPALISDNSSNEFESTWLLAPIILKKK